MANVQKQSQYQAGAGVGKMRGAHGIIVFGWHQRGISRATGFSNLQIGGGKTYAVSGIRHIGYTSIMSICL